MDRETRIIWKFLHAAYETGTLDRGLSLLGRLMPPDTDLEEAAGDFEDALSEKGLEGFESLFDRWIVPILSALGNGRAMEGANALLDLMEGAWDALVRASGDDPESARETLGSALERALALKPLVSGLLPALGAAAAPHARAYARENAGKLIASGLNRASEGILAADRENPDLIPGLVDEVAFRLDSGRVLGAARIVSRAFFRSRRRIFRPIMDAVFSGILGRFRTKGRV